MMINRGYVVQSQQPNGYTNFVSLKRRKTSSYILACNFFDIVLPPPFSHCFDFWGIWTDYEFQEYQFFKCNPRVLICFLNFHQSKGCTHTLFCSTHLFGALLLKRMNRPEEFQCLGKERVDEKLPKLCNSEGPAGKPAPYLRAACKEIKGGTRKPVKLVSVNMAEDDCVIRQEEGGRDGNHYPRITCIFLYVFIHNRTTRIQKHGCNCWSTSFTSKNNLKKNRP